LVALREWEWDRSTRSGWQMPASGAQGTGTAADGLDPIEVRKGAGFPCSSMRRRPTPSRTARNATSPLISRLARNGKHAAQWGSTSETYVYPVLGDLAVQGVDVGPC
jgi:hypothetical protein